MRIQSIHHYSDDTLAIDVLTDDGKVTFEITAQAKIHVTNRVNTVAGRSGFYGFTILDTKQRSDWDEAL